MNASQQADLILINATIRTVDRAMPLATALAVGDGKILAVGSDDTVDRFRGPRTITRDLSGRAVYPGFVDVHNHHAVAGTTDLFELSFSPALTLDQILDVIRDHAATLAPDAWITGGSWASTMLNDLNHSTVLARLDDAAGGRPVMLTEDSHHNRWVSSRALELAGITEASVPEEGTTCRDTTGALTGILMEGAGLRVAATYDRVGPVTAEDRRRASARGVELAATRGVTAFQDAAASIDIIRALHNLDTAGELNAWVVSSLLINDDIFGFLPTGHELLDSAPDYRSEHHRPDFVKIFLDGVPPAHTACFIHPYPAAPGFDADFTGETLLGRDELLGWLRTAAERGLGAKVHCTGDGSAKLLLDCVEELRASGFSDSRVHIAHGQFLAETDIKRMARLGVVADISPYIWYPGIIADAVVDVLGPDRGRRVHPNRALLDAGALIAGGSDWPVGDSSNPFQGIQGLVTRADPLGRTEGTLWVEQAITAEEALEVFTINAATAMGIGDLTGSLTPGKSADFIVLDRDSIAQDPNTIVSTRVLETWFAGERVFVSDVD